MSNCQILSAFSTFSASEEKRLSTPQIMGRDAEPNQHQENEVTDSSTEESSEDDWEDDEIQRRRQPSMLTAHCLDICCLLKKVN